MHIVSICNKLDLLDAFVAHYRYHCICVVESWLSDNIPDALVSPTGCNIYRRDLSSHGGGGFILLSSMLQASVTHLHSNSPKTQVLALDLHVKPTHVRVLLVYHPLCDAVDEVHSDNLLQSIFEATQVSYPVLVLCDFNKSSLDWSTFQGANSHD